MGSLRPPRAGVQRERAFIRYDGLNYRDVKQSLQEFVFNLNVPTRVGFQTPFTNLTMDLTVPSYYAEQGVVIGGRQQEVQYLDFQEEMGVLNRAFLEVMKEGDAKGRVFTFPIPTYNITENFRWDDPALEGLWEITAKYGVPYFANYVHSDMRPEDARSMCCRLRIDNRKLSKRGGGLFGASHLTGSIGVVTVNLPRIGYISKSEEEYVQNLNEVMTNARESLEIKRKVLERFTRDDLYPYMKHYLGAIVKRFGEYWKNHFSTIGIVGMNESRLNMFGKTIGSNEGRHFASKVLHHIRETLRRFQEETGNMYNLEATPAEGASYRLALIDRETFPSVISAQGFDSEGTADPFYTNSAQLPVNYSHVQRMPFMRVHQR